MPFKTPWLKTLRDIEDLPNKDLRELGCSENGWIPISDLLEDTTMYSLLRNLEIMVEGLHMEALPLLLPLDTMLLL